MEGDTKSENEKEVAVVILGHIDYLEKRISHKGI